ncbi:MAG: nucleoside-diphosphate sugar epimerase [Bacteroidetes bacterium RIFCSPHIGHO2_02_FULL_44_7]|nr:MAG: nucleoside-diphosphate sugar epimerase [Bacteroidetes bacterium RIFCSPHIGHO2_02_FULL_44_7]
MGKTAIILGATGLTGSLILDKLLVNEAYGKIKLFSRKASGREHPKLEEYLGDLLRLDQFEEEFSGDEVYCCIGTTRKKTPDLAGYRTIDFGIPASAAGLAKTNKIPVFAVVSALGANPKSSIFYNRIKGEMENAVLTAGIERTYILRPSIISGNRIERRRGEKISLALFKCLRPLLIGRMKRFRSIEAEMIANCMIRLANSDQPSQILESDEIC